MNIKADKFAEGRWNVRVNEQRIPGEVIGGNGRYFFIVNGAQSKAFETKKKAMEQLIKQCEGGLL
jgi:hypothetical protein